MLFAALHLSPQGGPPNPKPRRCSALVSPLLGKDHFDDLRLHLGQGAF
jgi:hypothetical protein